jgi:hypothetical protein
MRERKRTQALRGRNLLGILSPTRPSDVEGRRDEPFMAAVAPLRFLLAATLAAPSKVLAAATRLDWSLLCNSSHLCILKATSTIECRVASFTTSRHPISLGCELCLQKSNLKLKSARRCCGLPSAACGRRALWYAGRRALPNFAHPPAVPPDLTSPL